jgi:F420-non-reducing hydrogenase iron-sulfur subunit
MSNFEPEIIIFCCNWGVYAGIDQDDISALEGNPHFKIIRVMCSGKIEPTYIFQAFAQGADGVMVSGCPLGDCHYNTGNYKAKRRLLLLRKVLSQFGIEPERLRLEWFSASEVPKFMSVVNDFADEIAKMGSLHAVEKVALK